MKKTLSMLMAAVMLCVIMVGCGKNDSETVKWMNSTYAILTAVNEGDFDSVGGFKKNAMNKLVAEQLLTEWWDVTDRKTADETLDWILKEGHRTLFVEEMAEVSDMGLFELADEDVSAALDEMLAAPEDKEFFLEMMQLYKDKGDKAIDAWDYSRAMQLLGYYYVAEYYTEAEALDKSLEVAKIIQGEFISWDDFVTGYLNGYQYWQSVPASDSSITDRVAVYDKIKNGESGPYAVAWDITLEKTW